ncbi:hypothetical protein D1P53_003188 [Cryptococcus gattii VGV]|nr:hypothetical protein D1P53_003188 [Cryptococcus gattii VGV]
MHQQPHEIASRQAALHKALSTAYLNHQIAELENKVNATHIKSTVPQSKANAKGQDATDVNARQLHPQLQQHAPRDPNDDLGRPDDVEIDDDDEAEDWRVVVVDISALMWAKNAVKRLVAKGWEVIIPSEAISTLDLLKKGSNATAVAARQAARYIEHALRFHNVLSSDPSLAIQSGTNYKRGSGMRLQRAKETASVNSIVDELAIPPMDGEEDLPKWVEAVFSCVAYFKKIMDAEEKEWDAEDNGYERERGPILYVGNPPVFVELEQGRAEPTPSARDGDAKDGLDYMARAEGHVILQEAARFDLTLQVLRDDDVEVEASGLGGKKQRERRRGRKRGGGDGGGGGRRRDRDVAKKEPEPEREVRILLRRPSPTRETSPQDSHPSPLLPSPTSPVIPGPEIKRPPTLLVRPPPPPPHQPPQPPPSPGRPPPVPPPSNGLHHHHHRPPLAPESGLDMGLRMNIHTRSPYHDRPPPPPLHPSLAHHPHHPPPHPHGGHRPPPPAHAPPSPGLFMDELSDGSRGAHGHGHGRRGAPGPWHGHGGHEFARGRGDHGPSGGGRGGGKSGKGHGRRSKNRDNEFVLLQRPHSFVRPLPPGQPGQSQTQTQTGPSPSPSPSPNAPAISGGGGGNNKGSGKRQIPRIDDDPPVVLLQRPK